MRGAEIIVVGSGVSGLSCALELAQAGHRVSIWTAALPNRTTSRVAAAFWYPYRVDPPDRVLGWAIRSYRRFTTLAEGPTAAASGVRMREAIELFPERVADPPWAPMVADFRHAPSDELPPGYAHGVLFTAPVIEMPRYLPWLEAELARAGVTLHERPLANLGPALDAAEIVINTAGLGARELVGDDRLYAVRGQVVAHDRGSVERVTIDEHGPHGISYVVPRGDDVILGGVAEERVESLAVAPAQTRAIVERCTQLEPKLAGTREREVRVGLRPCRDEVRLDSEVLEGRLVVHDYGHGGAGVTLSWGCAEEVRERVTGWLGS